MNYIDAKILTVVTLAALAASLLSRVLAWRYRKAMQAMMQAALPAGHSSAAPTDARADPPADPPAQAPSGASAPVTLADNRRAAIRVSALLLLLTLGVALASAAITLRLPGMGTDLTLRRAVVLGLAQTWPAIPVLALLWRWPRGRTLLALAAWALAAAAVMALNSDGSHPLRDAFVYLALDASFALLWALLLCAGGATRAIAPWLLLPLAAVLAAAVGGLDLLAAATDAGALWLPRLVGTLGAWPTIALFALVPLLAFAWPARHLGQALAAAYRRRWLSELMVLFTVLTGLALLQRALTSLSSTGGQSLALLLPLALIPPVVWVASALGRPRGRPPTLLVLRVFQRDAAVSALFDLVIERWRLTGNTVLIAGTDLMERTIDADDIYAFLGRRLRTRFVLTPQDLAPRMADFEFARDPDGRHRVNEVYCHDQTWQLALDALVARADVVLMDLRGFQQRNRGCRYELGVLARAPRLARVAVLVDVATDLADAKRAAAGAPADRFDWIDTTHAGRRLARDVLARLFVAG